MRTCGSWVWQRCSSTPAASGSRRGCWSCVPKTSWSNDPRRGHRSRHPRCRSMRSPHTAPILRTGTGFGRRAASPSPSPRRFSISSRARWACGWRLLPPSDSCRETGSRWRGSSTVSERWPASSRPSSAGLSRTVLSSRSGSRRTRSWPSTGMPRITVQSPRRVTTRVASSRSRPASWTCRRRGRQARCCSSRAARAWSPWRSRMPFRSCVAWSRAARWSRPGLCGRRRPTRPSPAGARLPGRSGSCSCS